MTTPPADPSPVPARDDAPEDVKAPLFVYAFMNADTGRPVTACFSRPLAFEADAMSTYAGVPVRIIACAAVPSPDVLRAECDVIAGILASVDDGNKGPGDTVMAVLNAHAELRAMHTRLSALLAAVTRDGDAGR
jgi:hypothetical protein